MKSTLNMGARHYNHPQLNTGARHEVLEKAVEALQKETRRLGQLYEERDEGLLGRVAALEAPPHRGRSSV